MHSLRKRCAHYISNSLHDRYYFLGGTEGRSLKNKGLHASVVHVKVSLAAEQEVITRMNWIGYNISENNTQNFAKIDAGQPMQGR